MNYRQSVYTLFGEYHQPGFSTRVSPGGGGKEHLDDMAEAWIRGDRETVLEYVRARELEVRSRPVIVKNGRGRPRVIDREKVRLLKSQGMHDDDVARECNCSPRSVRNICTRS